MPYKYTGDYLARQQGDYLTARGGLPILAGLAMGVKFLGKKLIKKAPKLLGRAKQFLTRPTTAQARGALVGIGTTALTYRMGRRAGRAAAMEGLGPMEDFGPDQAGPRGFHWSESAGKWVKNRRMNVVNPRALRRAIRRAAGFGKIVRRMRGAIGRAATAVGVQRRAAKKGRR